MSKIGFAIALATTMVACTSGDHLGSGDAGLSDANADAPHPSGPPDIHYATGPSCRTTRPTGIGATSDAGIDCAGGSPNCCASDADCTSGQNGRCSYASRGSPTCTYDECFSNSDCPAGQACVCDDGANDTSFGANVCVPSNCRVDSDCSATGFCSPAFNPAFCNGYDVYGGVYCHTANDECNSNSDCPQNGDTMYREYCAFFPEVGIWKCASLTCAG